MTNPILKALKRQPPQHAVAEPPIGVGINIGAFALECLTPRPGSTPSILHVWDLYQHWCRSKRLAPISYAVFISDFLSMAKAVDLEVQIEGSHIVLKDIAFFEREAA